MLSVAEATTGLFAACKLGRRGLAAACIKLHASLNATDKYGMSPLHYACLYGHASLVQLLLVRGAADYYKEMIDPDKAAEMGQAVATRVINSPLHWAVLRGHLRCIWLLLQAGYSAQDLDQCGNNCLHLAASCTVPSRSLQLQIIRTIMYAGFDPDARNWYGQRAVDLLPADAHEARRLLVSAQECTRCATTGTPFGAEELRYLCHCTGAFFSEEASTSVSVRAVAEPDVLITAKGVAKRVPVMMPVRMGQELVYKVADAEAALDLALQPFAFTLPADADAAGDGRGGATDALAPGGTRSFGGGGAGSEGGDDMSGTCKYSNGQYCSDTGCSADIGCTVSSHPHDPSIAKEFPLTIHPGLRRLRHR
ncbi:ankyrin repeat domain-containing protein, partial [archaeon]